MQYEIYVDGIHLENVSEFKYLNGAKFNRKVTSGRRVAGAIKSLVNATDFQLECDKVCMKHCLYLFLCREGDEVV